MELKSERQRVLVERVIVGISKVVIGRLLFLETNLIWNIFPICGPFLFLAVDVHHVREIPS